MYAEYIGRRDRMIPRLTLALALVWCQSSITRAADATSDGKGQRVYTAAHSFHFFVPPILEDIAESAGIRGHEVAGMSYIGGSKVIQHWDIADDKFQFKKLLNEGNIDVVTLSPMHVPDEGIEKFTALGLEYNPDLRVTVQEFWLPYDIYDVSFRVHPKKVDHNAPTAEYLRYLHTKYFQDFDEHVAALNEKFGRQVLYVVPVGQAVIALREKIIKGEAPGLSQQEDLFIDPIGHPAMPLQALASYCHFAVIYGRSPVGLPIPAYFSDPETKKYPPEITDEMNLMLQELAWNAATEHPQSGVKKESSTTAKGKSATFVYVSKAPEQEIQIYQRAGDDLHAVDTFAVGGTPGSLAVSPDKKFIYASLRNINEIGSYAIDNTTGKLTLLNSVKLGDGANAAFVGTDRTGQWLISASYSAGRVVVHEINDDGSIAPRAVQSVDTAQTAHCIAVSDDNKMVYVPHVAPNAVYQFRFDEKTGMLADAGQAPGGDADAGPRHLRFHPTLDFAYTSDESGSSITSYAIDDEGLLKPTQTLSTLPSDFTENNSTAEVKVHPNGQFVWVSNRGHDSLAGFRIADDGTLTPIDQTPTEKTPRSFDIDPTGQYAYGAGEGSGNLAFFKCDPATGKLNRIETLKIGQALTWVLAVELGK